MRDDRPVVTTRFATLIASLAFVLGLIAGGLVLHFFEWPVLAIAAGGVLLGIFDEQGPASDRD